MRYALAGIATFWPTFCLLAAIGYPIIGALAGFTAVIAAWAVMSWIETGAIWSQQEE